MKKSLAPAVVFIMIFGGMNFASATEKPVRSGVVLISVGNMFSRPDEEAEVVSQAVLGTNIKILDSEIDFRGQGWFQIETPDTYRGWLKASAVRVVEEGKSPYAAEGPVFEIQSLMAFVYPLEDVTEQKPLTVVPIGAVLEAGECGERWCRVTLPCGASGWIQKGDIVLRDALSPPKRLSPDETVALAKRFLGLPYLWAGTTPLGLDCSGFAQLVYRLSGVEILRDADMQFAGSGLLDVPAGQENKGDLVFFGKTAGEIGHVGIMVNREEFIHATTFEKPVVQISKLSHPHWKALYQGARRPKL